MSKRNSISLCLIVKNEASRLNNCLESYKAVADEIVIVDTGSTDGTQNIARKFTNKIMQIQWRNDFSHARNLSLDNATGDWILWTDADDLIMPLHAAKINELREQYDLNHAFSFMIKNTQDGILGTVFNQIRMFPRRADIRFEFQVHEQVFPSIQKAGLEVHFTNILVLHTGYTDLSTVKNKQERNLIILESQTKEYPDNPVIRYSYAAALLDLGQANTEEQDDPAKMELARRVFLEASQLAGEQKQVSYIEAAGLIAAARICCRRKDYRTARIYLDQVRKLEPDNPEAAFFRGQVAEGIGQWEEARNEFELVLTAQEKCAFVPLDVNQLKINACSRLMRIYQALGDNGLMIAAAYVAMEIKLGRRLLPSDRGDIHFQAGQFELARQEYQKGVTNVTSPDSRSFLGLGKILILENNLRDALNWLKLGNRLFPDDLEIALLQADLNWDIGERDEARNSYQKLAGKITDETVKQRIMERTI